MIEEAEEVLDQIGQEIVEVIDLTGTALKSMMILGFLCVLIVLGPWITSRVRQLKRNRFDSTLGYPGEGPGSRGRSLPRLPPGARFIPAGTNVDDARAEAQARVAEAFRSVAPLGRAKSAGQSSTSKRTDSEGISSGEQGRGGGFREPILPLASEGRNAEANVGCWGLEGFRRQWQARRAARATKDSEEGSEEVCASEVKAGEVVREATESSSDVRIHDGSEVPSAWARRIREADEKVWLRAFTFDCPEVADALMELRRRRGPEDVDIRILLDQEKTLTRATKRTEETIHRLQAGGIAIRVIQGKKLSLIYEGNTSLRGAQHSKMLLTDTNLIIGSNNYTLASQTNHELNVEITLAQGSHSLSKIEGIFEGLWEVAEDERTATGRREASPKTVRRSPSPRRRLFKGYG
jgi:hypothetical protein